MNPSERSGRTALAALFAALAVLAAGLTATAQPGMPTPSGQPRPALVDPELRAEMATMAAGEQVEYLVAVGAAPDLSAIEPDRDAVIAALKETAETSQRPVLNELRARGAEVLNTFWLANFILVRSEQETVTELTANPAITQVYGVDELRVPEPQPELEADPTPNTVEDRTWGIDRIGAHRVWDELGLDGTGVRVAVLDTGVNIRHPDLVGKMATDDPDDLAFPGGWMEWDAAGNPVSSVPRDSQGHGTHVTGTVVGGNAGGIHIGVAPGAELMHGMVLPGGRGTTPQIIAGMQWALDPYDHEGNPAGQPAHVVNMSFGPLAGGINEAFAEPVRNMYAAGVLPVAAAGNCGNGCHGSPGNVYEALSVGATDVADDVADFSSGGTVARGDWSQPPAEWPDSWVVPDLSAPGVDVLSSIAASFGAPYGRSDGTSMAAPHVAGTAALMLSGNSELRPDEIVNALVTTSFFDERHGTARPNSRFGQGRIDAFQAASRVVLDTGVTGRVVDAGTGDPVEAVQVDVVEAGVTIRTTPDGRFEFRLAPGSYTLELFWAGRLVTTVPGVTVDDGMTSVDVALGGIAGEITDAASRGPVPDVQVDAAGTGVGTATGADGEYRLYLSPGSYTLELAAFGYEEHTVPGVEVGASSVTTADVALTPLPTGTVTGTVTYADSGHGVPGVPVELVGGHRTAVTDSDGSYTITNVPAGAHEVAAHPQLFTEPEPQAVTMSDGANEVVDFALACGGECSGLWVARYDGPAATGLDAADATAVSPDGTRLFVTGSSTGLGTQQDYATVAYDTGTGRQLWEARYDGPVSREDGTNDIVLSPDGSRVYVTGLSLGRGVGGSGGDYATVAYDAVTGEELWVARYNGPADNFDNARAVRTSPDGARVFITGQSRAVGPPAHTEYATVAYDAATGEELWVARYNGPSSDFDSAHDLVVAPDGSSVFVTGQSPGEGGQSSSQGSGWDYATVAYDAATGEQQWVARYDGPANALDQARALVISPAGDKLFVTGAATGVEAGPADFATVAYDPATGDELWVAHYDGPTSGIDQAKEVAVSPDGAAVYITGESWSGGSSETIDYATVAYDTADGAELWAARYTGPADDTDRARSVTVSPDGSRVIVTGGSTGAGTGFDYATVSYQPASGDELWVARYDGPPGDNDNAGAVAVSPDSSRVFVTGRSALGIGDDPLVAPSDFVTVAYDAEGSAQSPVFVAHDVRVVPGVARPGDPVQVRADVTNVGTGAGEYAATLVVDEVTEDATTVALGSGERTTVEWSLARDETARYPVQVGHATGTLLVVACDDTVTGVHASPLTVAEGVTCLDSGAQVRGAVTVHAGAGLLADGATINGPVSADGAAVVSLDDTTVTGRVSVVGATSAVSVISSRTGPLELSDNSTGDAPIVVSGNRVRGRLSCEGNEPAPVNYDDPNRVTGTASGQCAGL